MPTPTPGLRERKKRQTRTAIEAATIDLALELGLANVTVEAIAERADITARTFFNHFADKDDAVLGLSRDRDLSALPLPEDVAILDSSLTPFEVGVAILREQLVAMDSDAIVLDTRRRQVLASNPQLLSRELEKIVAIEERLSEVLEDIIRDRGAATDADAHTVALTITFTLGSVVRLASALWSAASTQQDFIACFDNAVAMITTITATDRTSK